MASLRNYFIALILLLDSLVLSACPCGCGSASPMALSPGEDWKFRVQAVSEGGIKELGTDGSVLGNPGPMQIETISFGVGYALRYDLSVAALGSVITNQHTGEPSVSSMGDPNVLVRWTPR